MYEPRQGGTRRAERFLCLFGEHFIAFTALKMKYCAVVLLEYWGEKKVTPPQGQSDSAELSASTVVLDSGPLLSQGLFNEAIITLPCCPRTYKCNWKIGSHRYEVCIPLSAQLNVFPNKEVCVSGKTSSTRLRLKTNEGLYAPKCWNEISRSHPLSVVL